MVINHLSPKQELLILFLLIIGLVANVLNLSQSIFTASAYVLKEFSSTVHLDFL